MNYDIPARFSPALKGEGEIGLIEQTLYVTRRTEAAKGCERHD